MDRKVYVRSTALLPCPYIRRLPVSYTHLIVLYEQHPAAHLVQTSHFGAYPDNITIGQQTVYEVTVQCVLYDFSLSLIHIWFYRVDEWIMEKMYLFRL